MNGKIFQDILKNFKGFKKTLEDFNVFQVRVQEI